MTTTRSKYAEWLISGRLLGALITIILTVGQVEAKSRRPPPVDPIHQYVRQLGFDPLQIPLNLSPEDLLGLEPRTIQTNDAGVCTVAKFDSTPTLERVASRSPGTWKDGPRLHTVDFGSTGDLDASLSFMPSSLLTAILAGGKRTQQKIVLELSDIQIAEADSAAFRRTTVLGAEKPVRIVSRVVRAGSFKMRSVYSKQKHFQAALEAVQATPSGKFSVVHNVDNSEISIQTSDVPLVLGVYLVTVDDFLRTPSPEPRDNFGVLQCSVPSQFQVVPKAQLHIPFRERYTLIDTNIQASRFAFARLGASPYWSSSLNGASDLEVEFLDRPLTICIARNGQHLFPADFANGVLRGIIPTELAVATLTTHGFSRAKAPSNHVVRNPRGGRYVNTSREMVLNSLVYVEKYDLELIFRKVEDAKYWADRIRRYSTNVLVKEMTDTVLVNNVGQEGSAVIIGASLAGLDAVTPKRDEPHQESDISFLIPNQSISFPVEIGGSSYRLETRFVNKAENSRAETDPRTGKFYGKLILKLELVGSDSRIAVSQTALYDSAAKPALRAELILSDSEYIHVEIDELKLREESFGNVLARLQPLQWFNFTQYQNPREIEDLKRAQVFTGKARLRSEEPYR